MAAGCGGDVRGRLPAQEEISFLPLKKSGARIRRSFLFRAFPASPKKPLLWCKMLEFLEDIMGKRIAVILVLRALAIGAAAWMTQPSEDKEMAQQVVLNKIIVG